MPDTGSATPQAEEPIGNVDEQRLQTALERAEAGSDLEPSRLTPRPRLSTVEPTLRSTVAPVAPEVAIASAKNRRDQERLTHEPEDFRRISSVTRRATPGQRDHSVPEGVIQTAANAGRPLKQTIFIGPNGDEVIAAGLGYFPEDGLPRHDEGEVPLSAAPGTNATQLTPAQQAQLDSYQYFAGFHLRRHPVPEQPQPAKEAPAGLGRSIIPTLAELGGAFGYSMQQAPEHLVRGYRDAAHQALEHLNESINDQQLAKKAAPAAQLEQRVFSEAEQSAHALLDGGGGTLAHVYVRAATPGGARELADAVANQARLSGYDLEPIYEQQSGLIFAGTEAELASYYAHLDAKPPSFKPGQATPPLVSPKVGAELTHFPTADDNYGGVEIKIQSQFRDRLNPGRGNAALIGRQINPHTLQPVGGADGPLTVEQAMEMVSRMTPEQVEQYLQESGLAFLSEEGQGRHIAIAAGTGSGKSVLMYHLLAQHVQRNPDANMSIMLDMANTQSLDSFAEKFNGDTVLVAPGDDRHLSPFLDPLLVRRNEDGRLIENLKRKREHLVSAFLAGFNGANDANRETTVSRLRDAITRAMEESGFDVENNLMTRPNVGRINVDKLERAVYASFDDQHAEDQARGRVGADKGQSDYFRNVGNHMKSVFTGIRAGMADSPYVLDMWSTIIRKGQALRGEEVKGWPPGATGPQAFGFSSFDMGDAAAALQAVELLYQLDQADPAKHGVTVRVGTDEAHRFMQSQVTRDAMANTLTEIRKKDVGLFVASADFNRLGEDLAKLPQIKIVGGDFLPTSTELVAKMARVKTDQERDELAAMPPFQFIVVDGTDPQRVRRARIQTFKPQESTGREFCDPGRYREPTGWPTFDNHDWTDADFKLAKSVMDGKVPALGDLKVLVHLAMLETLYSTASVQAYPNQFVEKIGLLDGNEQTPLGHGLSTAEDPIRAVEAIVKWGLHSTIEGAPEQLAAQIALPGMAKERAFALFCERLKVDPNLSTADDVVRQVIRNENMDTRAAFIPVQAAAGALKYSDDHPADESFPAASFYRNAFAMPIGDGPASVQGDEFFNFLDDHGLNDAVEKYFAELFRQGRRLITKPGTEQHAKIFAGQLRGTTFAILDGEALDADYLHAPAIERLPANQLRRLYDEISDSPTVAMAPNSTSIVARSDSEVSPTEMAEAIAAHRLKQLEGDLVIRTAILPNIVILRQKDGQAAGNQPAQPAMAPEKQSAPTRQSAGIPQVPLSGVDWVVREGQRIKDAISRNNPL